MEESVLEDKIDYSDAQWSPYNPDGKKSYGRNFPLHLQFMNASVTKPHNLPDLDCIMNKVSL